MVWNYAVKKGSWTVFSPDAFGLAPQYPAVANPEAKAKDQARAHARGRARTWG